MYEIAVVDNKNTTLNLEQIKQKGMHLSSIPSWYNSKIIIFYDSISSSNFDIGIFHTTKGVLIPRGCFKIPCDDVNRVRNTRELRLRLDFLLLRNAEEIKFKKWFRL